jgi:hypothetical protein
VSARRKPSGDYFGHAKSRDDRLELKAEQNFLPHAVAVPGHSEARWRQQPLHRPVGGFRMIRDQRLILGSVFEFPCSDRYDVDAPS